MTSSASDPSARRLDLVRGLALLLGAVAIAAWVWTRPASAPTRVAPPPTIVVDEDLARGPDGVASVRVRVVGPTILRVELTAPAGTEAKLGPGRPIELTPRDLPDPAATTAWTHEGGASVQEVRAFTSGMYVLHLAPPSTGPLHVRLTQVAWGGAATSPAGKK